MAGPKLNPIPEEVSNQLTAKLTLSGYIVVRAEYTAVLKELALTPWMMFRRANIRIKTIFDSILGINTNPV